LKFEREVVEHKVYGEGNRYGMQQFSPVKQTAAAVE
jgi:hypothetical protein